MRWWIISIIPFLDTWPPFYPLYLLSSCKIQRVSTFSFPKNSKQSYYLPTLILFLRLLVLILVEFFLYHINPLDFIFHKTYLKAVLRYYQKLIIMVLLFFFHTVKKGRLDKTTGKSGSPFSFCFTFFFLRHGVLYHTEESFKLGTALTRCINCTVQNKCGKYYAYILKINLSTKVVSWDNL